jgi:cytochrome P450
LFCRDPAWNGVTPPHLDIDPFDEAFLARPYDFHERLREAGPIVFLESIGCADPRRWERADEFDISRVVSSHVGFGFGIHQCLGQMVARQEAEVLLRALLPRVAKFCLAGTAQRRLNNTLRALASVPVAIDAVAEVA